LPTLIEIRKTASGNLAKLPAKYKKLTAASKYPVLLSKPLVHLVESLKRKLAKNEKML